MDEAIDEDIEALLYAQVYYGKSDTTQLAIPEQVENIPNEEHKDETVNATIQEPNKLSEEHIQGNNFKEHQDGNEDQPVNIEEIQDQRGRDSCSDKQDQRARDSCGDKPISNSTHITEAPEKQDRFEIEPKSQLLRQSEVPQQYIHISTTTADTVQTEKPTQIAAQIPLLTGTSHAPNQQLLNNITINQFICPGENFLNRLKDFRETIVWSKRCQQDYKRYQKGKLTERDFFNILKRRRKLQRYNFEKQEKIRKAYFEKQQKISSTEIICLSDSDNSDIEIISVQAQSIAMKKTGNDRTKIRKITSASPTVVEDSVEDDSDDDAIIYVEPPPVPVINVEDGTDSEVEASKEVTAEIQDDASNDFLAPTNTSEQFNFSLHGSEFQNTEFVRPTDPTDAYETESSTTTSDFNKESNREFSNSVKTIVFDEVDFPREDIFEGSNLDKFGELITPQRGRETNLTKIKDVQADDNVGKSKKLNVRASSESSSESEYDARETHRNLPDLSPMIGVSHSPKKTRKHKIKPSLEHLTKDTQPELKSKVIKKSKQNLFSKENDGILDAEGTENTTENSHQKSKKRNSGDVVEEYSPKKKAKKKKTGDKTVEELEVTMDKPMVPESSDILVTSTPKRSSKELPELATAEAESSKKKNKKKKKQAKTEEGEEIASNVVQQSAEHTNKKKSKKRKGSKTADQVSDFEHTVDEFIEPLIPAEKDDLDDGSKKKAKKRKQRLSSAKEASPENVQVTTNAENEVIPEESNAVPTSQVLLSEGSSSKRKNRKNKQNSSNKTNSNEDTENIEKANQQSNESRNNNNEEEESLAPSNTLETNAGDKASGESQEDEDVVIIEPAVPVHTIESSDSGDDDIITFDDLTDELKLANISAEISKPNDSHHDKFDIECIKSKMSDDPDKWKILSVDKYNITISKKRIRCNRCRQFGHLAVNCTNKPSIPSCTLCGYEGHQEPRCPNKVCFTCGKPGNYSTVFCYKCSGQRSGKCHLCKLTGHSAKYCPDLWRRYYLTIKEGPLITPKRKNSIVIPRSKQWCSGCASRGHLEFECNSYKWMREYPTSSPHVFDYGDVYQTEKKKEDRVPSSDLRNKLLQNRSRNNRSISQHENRADNSQIVDKEGTAQNELAIETPVEATVTATEESSAVDVVNQINESAENTNIEVSQPLNDTVVTVNSEVSVDKNVDLVDHQNQDRLMHQQVSSTTETTLSPVFPQETNRPKKSRQLRRRGKLNPLSMMKSPAVPKKFTPYHSVLNPYSLLATPADNSLNEVPSNHDIGAPFIDTMGAEPVQNVPVLGLFNQIPNNLLAQQVANLMSAFSGYQQTNQMQYDFSQDNMNHGPDYNAQVPSSRYNSHDMNYLDFSQPIPEERYFDNMIGQDDRGFTHMSYETNYRNRDRQYHRDAWTDENFRSRDYSGRNTPYQASSRSETYVPLSGGQEDIDGYKPRHLYNVEEATTKKFTNFNILSLSAFVGTEMETLDKIKNVDAREYKQKLNSVEQLKKVDIKTNAIKKQIYIQYKNINMYLFGVRKLADGKKHLEFLRNFVCNPGRQLHDAKRDALLNAYGYIFGGEHPNFNYRKYLNALTVGRGR